MPKNSPPLFKEFDFQNLIGIEISQMSDEELRVLNEELQQRQASHFVRRTKAKKESNKLTGKPNKNNFSLDDI